MLALRNKHSKAKHWQTPYSFHTVSAPPKSVATPKKHREEATPRKQSVYSGKSGENLEEEGRVEERGSLSFYDFPTGISDF
jgi:hypothetical protein